MPTPPLSRTTAEMTVSVVEELLKKGWKKSDAMTEACKIHGISRAALYSRLSPCNPVAVTHGLRVDWSLEKTNLSKPIDLQAIPEAESKVPDEAENKDARRWIALEDENRNLKRQIREMHRQELDREAICEILGLIKESDKTPPAWILEPAKKREKQTPHLPMTIWSDWHCGEVVSRSETNGMNEYGVEIFEERVRRLVSKTIELSMDFGPGNYPGIVINLLGDFCSGALHPELLKTDAEEVIASTLRVFRVLKWALGEMLNAFGKVYCPCVSGNHGRNTSKPEFKRTVYSNFDWMIAKLLEEHFSDNPNIAFLIDDSNEAYYAAFGLKFLAVHGDMLGVKGGDGLIGLLGPISRGEFKVGRQATVSGRPYDVLLMGHWHTPLWLPRVIVAGTLKGWDEYAKNALRAAPSPPSQPLWFVAPKWGIVSRMEVYVADPVIEERFDWGAWRAA